MAYGFCRRLWPTKVDYAAATKVEVGYPRAVRRKRYDNVVAQGYPAMLVTAGLTDPRVTYWEPAKWVARLRALKTDDNPILLRTNMDAGHGGASGRFDRLEEVGLAYAFVLIAFGRTSPNG